MPASWWVVLLKIILTYICSQPFLLLSPPLEHWTCYAYYSFSSSRMSYRWNLSVGGLFCVWLPLLSTMLEAHPWCMFQQFHCTFEYDFIILLSIHFICWVVHCTDILRIICLAVNGCLGFSSILAFINTTSMNSHIWIILWTCFHFSFISTKEWNYWVYNNYTFCFIRNCYCSLAILHSWQQCMSLPGLLHPCQHLILSVLNFRPTNWCALVCNCGFWYHSSNE